MKFKLGRTKSLFSSVFFLMLTMVLLLGMIYGIRYVCYKQGDKNMPIYKVDTDDKKISMSFDVAWGSNNIDDILEILDKNNEKAVLNSILTSDNFSINLSPSLSNKNLNEIKIQNSDFLSKRSDSTKYKMKQVLLQIMTASGLLKRNKNNFEIIRPLISNEVKELLNKVNDESYYRTIGGLV